MPGDVAFPPVPFRNHPRRDGLQLNKDVISTVPHITHDEIAVTKELIDIRIFRPAK
jgi:hypothetical protein